MDDNTFSPTHDSVLDKMNKKDLDSLDARNQNSETYMFLNLNISA
jgi:hypothetical protein